MADLNASPSTAAQPSVDALPDPAPEPVRWQRPLPDGVLGRLCVAGDAVLVGCRDGFVYCLDLQAGQAQNRFHNELEDWLAAVVSSDLELDDVSATRVAAAGGDPAELVAALERLNKTLSESGTKTATQATAHLAEGIQGLVKHMRSEQQMIRDWVEAQSNQQGDLKALLERLLEQRAKVEP